MSFTGNFLILYGSLVRGAVKMEAMDLTMIYNNAVCNILLMILFFIPVLITLIHGKYVLGDPWCVFTAYFLPSSIMVYMLLINAFGTVLRVWLLNKPPKVRTTFPISRVYWVMAGCFIVSIAPSLILPLMGAREQYFMVAKLSCSVKMEDNDTAIKIVWWVYTIVLIVIPLFVLTAANVYAGRVIDKVLKSSRTVTKEQRCRAHVTISTVSWSFLLSYLPIIIVHVMKLSGWKGKGEGVEPSWCLFATYFLSIASVTKPFILHISNVKFREYVNGLLRCGGGGGGDCGNQRDNHGTALTTSSCRIKVSKTDPKTI